MVPSRAMTGCLSVGVDVAEERKGLDLVGLDADRRIVASERRQTLDQIVKRVAELRPDVVCIDCPSQWSLTGRPREAERRLRTVGINAFATPSKQKGMENKFYIWMRVGIDLYNALAATPNPYPTYRGGKVRHVAAEFFPHASAVVLHGAINNSKDKRAFRRQVLLDNGVVEAGQLRSIDQIDAALGALTGLIAICGGANWVGDEDGALLLPAPLPTQRLFRLPRVASLRQPAAVIANEGAQT